MATARKAHASTSFEKSKSDKKGFWKEGSKKDIAMDKKQAKKPASKSKGKC